MRCWILAGGINNIIVYYIYSKYNTLGFFQRGPQKKQQLVIGGCSAIQGSSPDHQRIILDDDIAGCRLVGWWPKISAFGAGKTEIGYFPPGSSWSLQLSKVNQMGCIMSSCGKLWPRKHIFAMTSTCTGTQCYILLHHKICDLPHQGAAAISCHSYYLWLEHSVKLPGIPWEPPCAHLIEVSLQQFVGLLLCWSRLSIATTHPDCSVEVGNVGHKKDRDVQSQPPKTP